MVGNGSLTRIYPFNYTINSNNTWEYKTVTIPGETSGTWTKDETWGMAIHFQHGVGSNRSATAGAWVNGNALIRGVTGQTNLLATNGATWNMTGLQLEAGTVATPFERRFIGQELALCQRYYEIVPGTTASWQGVWYHHRFQVQKRSAPNLSVFSGSVSGASYDGGIDPTMSFRLPAGTTTATATDWKIAASAEL
jgi:hypothetical protein